MGNRDWRAWLGGLILTLGLAGTAGAMCMPGQLDLRGDWGQAQFQIELADDNTERARGLMYRHSLAQGAGMLFVYPQPQRAVFWMKNTLIPLDMLFVDSKGRVLKVHENAIPRDLTPIDGGEGVLAVFEVNGGLARRLGIKPGTVLRHPAFGIDAIWPCTAP